MTNILELSDTALAEAARTLGDGAVIMVNLLRFPDVPDYPACFPEAKSDSRTGYYEGYVGGFREACTLLGVEPELLHAGPRMSRILSSTDDDWDENRGDALPVLRRSQANSGQRNLRT